MMNKFYSLNSGFFVLVFLAGWAAGAQVVQHAPYHGATHYVMDIALINDDPGAIFDVVGDCKNGQKSVFTFEAGASIMERFQEKDVF